MITILFALLVIYPFLSSQLTTYFNKEDVKLSQISLIAHAYSDEIQMEPGIWAPILYRDLHFKHLPRHAPFLKHSVLMPTGKTIKIFAFGFGLQRLHFLPLKSCKITSALSQAF